MRVRDEERRIEREKLHVDRLHRGERLELSRITVKLSASTRKLHEAKRRFADVMKQLRCAAQTGYCGNRGVAVISNLERAIPEAARELVYAQKLHATLTTTRITAAGRVLTLRDGLEQRSEQLKAFQATQRLEREEGEREEISQVQCCAESACSEAVAAGHTSEVPTSIPSALGTGQTPERGSHTAKETPLNTAPSPQVQAQVDDLWHHGEEEGIRVSANVGGEDVQILLSDHQRRKLDVEIEADNPAGATRMRRRRLQLEEALRDAGIASRVQVFLGAQRRPL